MKKTAFKANSKALVRRRRTAWRSHLPPPTPRARAMWIMRARRGSDPRGVQRHQPGHGGVVLWPCTRGSRRWWTRCSSRCRRRLASWRATSFPEDASRVTGTKRRMRGLIGTMGRAGCKNNAKTIFLHRRLLCATLLERHSLNCSRSLSMSVVDAHHRGAATPLAFAPALSTLARKVQGDQAPQRGRSGVMLASHRDRRGIGGACVGMQRVLVVGDARTPGSMVSQMPPLGLTHGRAPPPPPPLLAVVAAPARPLAPFATARRALAGAVDALLDALRADPLDETRAIVAPWTHDKNLPVERTCRPLPALAEASDAARC